MALKERHEIKEEYTWNLSDIYRDKEAFEKDFTLASERIERVKGLEEHFTDDEKTLKKYGTSLKFKAYTLMVIFYG
jgi:oligoendopeptidase F